MALSPIQMFQQQQNPLAQILAGGNETITGIFDKAIQIGRDMSNKQLQQEQDMMAMRNTETAMAQRRAENLQQNNEDAIKFARGAFESDRKFGVDQTQQQFQNQRVTAQDLFSNQQTAQRTDIAERGLNLSENRFAADKAQVEQARVDTQAAAEARRAEVSSLYPSAPQELQGPTQSGGKLFAPAPPVSREQAAGKATAIEREISTNKNLSPKEVEALATERARLQGLYPGNTTTPTKPVDSLLQQSRQLDIEKKSIDLFKTKAQTMITGNPDAFIPTGSWMAEKYGTEGTGKERTIKQTKEDVKGASPEEMRQAAAYQEDPVAAEMAFAEKYATAEEYADALPNAKPVARQARIKFWNEYMGALKGGDSSAPTTSAAPSGSSYVAQKAGGL